METAALPIELLAYVLKSSDPDQRHSQADRRSIIVFENTEL
ncbi:hypothetical protein [Lysobacter gummosus]